MRAPRPAKRLGFLQDVSEQKRHHQELEYHYRLAQQAELAADIGHFIFNLKTETYTYVSSGFANIHGVSEEQYMASVSSREDDMADVHPGDYERLG
jgi:hypothetical protein